MPKNTAAIANTDRQAQRNGLLPTTLGGTRPSSPAARSRTTNATIITAQSRKPPITSGEVYPFAGATVSAVSSANRLTASSSEPGTSTLDLERSASTCTSFHVAATAIAAIGRLRKKM